MATTRKRKPKRTKLREPACEFCGVRCSGGRPGEFREVTGWVESRSAGGAHAIVDAKPTGRAACGGCVALLRRGVDPRSGERTTQERML